VRRRARNRSQRQAARTQFRKAQTTIVGGNLEEAPATIKSAISGIDKAASKGIIHPNNAARHKSRLMKKYNAAAAEAQAAAAATAAEAPRRPTRRRRSAASET
jgi:small subunit ribosomal protein S20